MRHGPSGLMVSRITSKAAGTKPRRPGRAKDTIAHGDGRAPAEPSGLMAGRNTSLRESERTGKTSHTGTGVVRVGAAGAPSSRGGLLRYEPEVQTWLAAVCSRPPS